MAEVIFVDNFEQKKVSNENEYKVYRTRWLVLVLFVLYSISNLVQYIEFSVIAHIITEYYEVSYEAVDWTTMIASVVYIVVSIPGTYVIDKVVSVIDSKLHYYYSVQIRAFAKL